MHFIKKTIILILCVAIGAFIWWLFSPLLFDTEVRDELNPELKARLEAQRIVDERRPKSTDGNSTPTQDTDELVTSAPTETSTPTEPPRTYIDGPFTISDTPGHPASGAIQVVYSPEETLIQYKNYDGTNGPDLFVYLAKDLGAKEFINLGAAKGNKGDILYGVPLDIDLDDYTYIMTWCKTFGVLFDYAEIK